MDAVLCMLSIFFGSMIKTKNSRHLGVGREIHEHKVHIMLYDAPNLFMVCFLELVSELVWKSECNRYAVLGIYSFAMMTARNPLRHR